MHVCRGVGQRRYSLALWSVLVTLCAGCGYPRPRPVEGKKDVYEFAYCSQEKKCFRAAEKVCQGSFRITQYGHRPQRFVCEVPASATPDEAASPSIATK